MSAPKFGQGFLAVYLSGGSVVHALRTNEGRITTRRAVCGRVPKKRGPFNGNWIPAGKVYAMSRQCPKCFPAPPKPTEKE